MARQKTLKKNYILSDGNVVITETVEKTLTKDDLQAEKMNYLQRQSQINKQILGLQDQHSALENAIVELDKMIEDVSKGTIAKS